MVATSDGKCGAAGATSRWWRVARWSVWTQPQHVIGPVLTVELAAVALTAVQAARLPDLTSRDLLALGLLTVLGVAHTEVAVHVERARHPLASVVARMATQSPAVPARLHHIDDRARLHRRIGDDHIREGRFRGALGKS